MSRRRVLVTGTDTGVGKTVASALGKTDAHAVCIPDEAAIEFSEPAADTGADAGTNRIA